MRSDASTLLSVPFGARYPTRAARSQEMRSRSAFSAVLRATPRRWREQPLEPDLVAAAVRPDRLLERVQPGRRRRSPPRESLDPDIRFLSVEELEALLRAVPHDDMLGPTEHTLYMLAAMTGLRQGELVALRWRDIDWAAGVVRVRRTYSRGEWGTPKSRRSSRAVPLPDRVATELERHFQRSAYQRDDDAVFCHPHTGQPYDASKLRKRFYDAMADAGMKERCGTGGITFHSLRHTFGTRIAAVGVPMRTLQEWMGHRDYTTTLIYADFAPDQSGGAAYAERAFGEVLDPGGDFVT